MYWILMFSIVTPPASAIQDLKFPYFPWRTTLEEESRSQETRSALCKLPPYPEGGGYVVVDQPDARPGDAFQNVSLVQYKRVKDDEQEIYIQALHCSAGEWHMDVFQAEIEELYFNTSWCQFLCASYKYSDNMRAPQRPTENYNTVAENRDTIKYCVLPPYPAGGGYFVEGQPNAKPGDVYLQTVKVSIFEPTSEDNIYKTRGVTCEDGVWYTNTYRIDRNYLKFSRKTWCPLLCAPSPTSEPTAPPEINQSSTEASEKLQSDKNCTLPPYPDNGGYTVATRSKAGPGEVFDAVRLDYSCNSNKQIVGSKSVFCVNGVWSGEVPKCISCGTVTSVSGKSISKEDALRKELPWHIGVYAKNYSPYRQICSGTIVARNLVVTAAHCFWREPGGVLPASRFAVAAAKIHRAWDHPGDAAVQKADVNEIKVSRKFRGSVNNFKDDIALLMLATPLVYGDYVSPVCLDFDVEFDERQLLPENSGKFASWGPTDAGSEDDDPSILQVGWLPYTSRGQCAGAASPDYRAYITDDKICAGDGKGIGPCVRDGGAGLVFRGRREDQSQEHYYLRGIASVTVTDGGLCNSSPVSAFTHVLKHEVFLKKNLRNAIW